MNDEILAKITEMLNTMDIIEFTEDDTMSSSISSIKVADYSEKSIVVYGKTMPIKEDLKKLGGKYNANLIVDGQKTSAWIFSKNKTEEVTKYISDINAKQTFKLVLKKRD